MAGFLGTISGQVRLDIRQAVAAYATLRAQNARTVYALRGTGDSFVQAGQTMSVAGLGLVYVFGRAVNAAAEFERKMDFFSAVSNTSAEDMDRLSKYTLQLAQDTIYSADQIAEGFIELGKSGVTATQIMEGIGDAMANLGAAGDIPLAQSGQIITSTIQQFDLAATDAVKVVDLLAGAANASIADIDDIGVSLKYVGGVANAVGLTFDDTATAISLLARAGIRGSTAGTSLRQMLVSLGGATGPAQEVLKELGIITEDGANKFFDAEGKAKSLSQVFQILQDHTAELTAKQRLAALRTIFNNRALAAASILTRDGAKGFEMMNKEMAKTTAADVARERLDNLSGDIEILRGNIETLLVTAGGPFQETFRDWVQNITKLVQAFSDLDPNTQKMIVQFIGLSGAALVAMGVFNIIVGTIFRFAASMLKMGAAIAFVFKWLRAALFLFGIITGGAISIGLLAIVAVVLALAGAFILAYKKIKPFRDFINGLGKIFMEKVVEPLKNGIDDLIEWFKKLPDNAGKAWDSFTSALSRGVDSVKKFFSDLGSSISSAVDSALNTVGNFISGVVNFFATLPGRVLGLVTSLVDRVTELFTFRNIGYALGFVIGTILRGFLNLGSMLLTVAGNIGTGIMNFFMALPARIGAALTAAATWAQGVWNGFRARMLVLSLAVVNGVLNFFRRLPARLGALARAAANFFTNAASRMVTWAATNGPRIASGIINGILGLPSRITGIMGRVLASLVNIASDIYMNALTLGVNIYEGVRAGIAGLPRVVGDVLSDVIAAFLGVIRDGWNAARDFAAGLWEGFKDGLGINSPSYIERQMWQMTGVIDEETKKMGRRTMDVQALSNRLAKTQFRTGDMGVPDVRTLSTARAVQARAAITGVPLNRRGSSQGGAAAGGTGQPLKLVEGRLSLDKSGRAFIRGVASEVVDDNNYYASSRNRTIR